MGQAGWGSKVYKRAVGAACLLAATRLGGCRCSASSRQQPTAATHGVPRSDMHAGRYYREAARHPARPLSSMKTWLGLVSAARSAGCRQPAAAALQPWAACTAGRAGVWLSRWALIACATLLQTTPHDPLATTAPFNPACAVYCSQHPTQQSSFSPLHRGITLWALHMFLSACAPPSRDPPPLHCLTCLPPHQRAQPHSHWSWHWPRRTAAPFQLHAARAAGSAGAQGEHLRVSLVRPRHVAEQLPPCFPSRAR